MCSLKCEWHTFFHTIHTFLGEIHRDVTHVNFLLKECFLGKKGGRERIKLKSLTDWHVDSEENNKSAMAEHCALR